MEILTQPLERPTPAVANGGRGVAVAISLLVHGIAASVLIMVPLKIVEWSSTRHQGPFEVTLAEESLSEAVEEDSRAEEVEDPPEVKPAQPARVAPPTTITQVVAVKSDAPQMAQGQLAFVTVPETFEPSLPFETEETEVAEPEPEPETAPPKPISKPSPTPARPAKKSSSASSKVVSARVIRNPSPAYPATARDKGQQGTVIFTVAINSKGSVNGLRLSKSSGFSMLDAAAEKAVKRWRFAPASRGGVAVASQVRVPIQFRIQ